MDVHLVHPGSIPDVLRASVRYQRCLCDNNLHQPSQVSATREKQIVPRRRRGSPVHQNVQVHISSRSLQHSEKISIFLTSGRAEETDGEQGLNTQP